MPRSAIRCRTLASCWRASVISWPTWTPDRGPELLGDLPGPAGALQAQCELAAYPTARADARLHHPPGPGAISIADRATTVGPITGIWTPINLCMLAKLSRTPVIMRFAAA